MKLFPQMIRRAFLAGGALLLTGSSLWAWGPMHAAITESAFDALPAWEQELLAAQRTKLIEFDCMIPDLARAAAQRKTLGRYVILPNGDVFTHEPHSREHNVAQMLHYVTKAVESIRANELDEASRWAGCLLHFLEDCGSPAHSMPGDNQHGLMKDLLAVPERFRDLPLHGLIEAGSLKIDLAGYRPQLLGTTPEEAVSNLVERLNAEIRNARAQVIPILEGVFKDAPEEIDRGRLRAATMDAQVAADALHTIISMGRNRFDPAETAALETVDVSALTPLEVVSQSYFPQHTYFSNPYFGYPVRNGIMAEGKTRMPLVLHVIEEAVTRPREFANGFGLGTSSRLTFVLPPKVYDRFECFVGLHASLGGEGLIGFRIYADGEAVFDSGVITGADPARKVSLPIWRVSQLSIETQSREAKPGTNYGVIGAPVLHKAKGPPKLDQDKTR